MDFDPLGDDKLAVEKVQCGSHVSRNFGEKSANGHEPLIYTNASEESGNGKILANQSDATFDAQDVIQTIYQWLADLSPETLVFILIFVLAASLVFVNVRHVLR